LKAVEKQSQVLKRELTKYQNRAENAEKETQRNLPLPEPVGARERFPEQPVAELSGFVTWSLPIFSGDICCLRFEEHKPECR
jgi:hypothetical protein